MAIRLQAPKLLKNVRHFTRTLSSGSSSTSTSTSAASPFKKPEPTIQKGAVNRRPNSWVLDINNHEKHFALLPTTKLLREALILHLAAAEPVVDFGIWVMDSRLMDIDLAREAVMGAIRCSFYEHFCAGESASEVKDCVRKVNEAGLRGMISFSVEQTGDVSECQQNLLGFLETVQSVKSLPPDSASFVAVKISAICPMSLLKRVSDLLRWQQRDPSFNLPWKLNNFPIFSDCSPLYHTLQKPEPLTLQEENELQSTHQRLQKLCQECLEANVPLTVDAEDTFLQPAIDYLTYNAAILHNKEGQLAAAKASDLGIKGNKKLEFAQLYGMAEALSFSLRNAGFQVSKYMPYGPVDKIIPYLLRRAEENRGFLSASTLDRQLMRKELMRRVNAAMF